MSDEDPWKNWYQAERPPAGEAGSDMTHDMTVSSRMPPPGSGQGGGAWPQQPPRVSAPGSPGAPGSQYGGAPSPYGGAGSRYGGAAGYGGAPPGARPARGGRRWRFWGRPGRHGRRIALVIGVVVVVLLAGVAGTYFWINGKLNKSVALPAYSGASAGTNWLIVGSDSRSGLTRAQADALHTGTVGGDDSDSLMLLHTGGGKPVLISIPRDSYVPIPGYGENKINAALAFGGPALLVKTVEQATGLRIDHYMGIGFDGLVSVVNTVGGVRICLPTAISDADSGVNLKAGCQNLNGTQALAFVRDRHSFATSDLQRIQDQRAFLSALLAKATSPGVYLNPLTSVPFASTAAGSIAVDKGTSLYDLLQAAMALRGPETGTVPIANAAYETSNAGEAVLWNRSQALELFNALQKDKPVPAGLLSGTKVG
jgi:LCP family protein required for cell wall assembly